MLLFGDFVFGLLDWFTLRIVGLFALFPIDDLIDLFVV